MADNTTDNVVLMGVFDGVQRASGALARLREMGLHDKEIEVLSSLPYPAAALGRPHVHTSLPKVSLFGAVTGFLIGFFFIVVTPYLYVIRVGGHPIVPVPASAVLLFEFTMLGLIIGTFFGMVFLNEANYGKAYYYPEITDGRIGLIFPVPGDRQEEFRSSMQTAGAETVFEPELRPI